MDEQADIAQVSETKRGRVRRLLIDPLSADGFRFKKGTDAEYQKKHLARIADDVAYLSDRALETLRESLKTKGEGTARCFWPCYATIIGLAEFFQPRALEDTPKIAGWFASAAGKKSRDAGRLVPEFLFWEKHKRPPLSAREWQSLEFQARDMADKAERIRDRIRRGYEPFGDDGRWLAWYEEQHRRALALVEGAA